MAAPVNTVLPTISGTARVGATLTGLRGSWTGADSFAEQWELGPVIRYGGAPVTYQGELVVEYWAEISGETALTYLAALSALNEIVRLRVTATNGDGSTIAYSLMSDIIQNTSAGAGGVLAPVYASLSGGSSAIYDDEE